MKRRVQLTVAGRRWQTDLDDPTPLSIRLEFGGPQPRAFGLDEAAAEPIGFDGQLADTDVGASFNCDTVRLIPHGNGTHTEGVGHLVRDTAPVGELADEALIPCTVATVATVGIESTDETYAGPSDAGDRVVTGEALADTVGALDLPAGFSHALVLRTAPNSADKRTRDYSDTNPPYLTDDAVALIREWGVDHLVVDLPSVDREHDGGGLANHRAFWGLGLGDEAATPDAKQRTITEMAFVPDDVDDGAYFLTIEVPDFDLDAAPSRPLLYEALPVE